MINGSKGARTQESLAATMFQYRRVGSSAVFIADVVFGCLAALSIVLRVLARKRRHLPLKADDWFAFLSFAGSLAVVIVGCTAANAYHSEIHDTAHTTLEAKLEFITQLLYILAVGFAKISILFLYQRIFTGFRIPLIIRCLVLLTVSWIIAFFFATLFQDSPDPIECFWVGDDTKCSHSDQYSFRSNYLLIASAASDVAIDLCILCLPAFFLRKLKLSPAKKLALCAVFGLGTLVLVASITRLVYAVLDLQMFTDGTIGRTGYTDHAERVSYGAWYLWPGLESCLSTICANLPCYVALKPKRPCSVRLREGYSFSWPYTFNRKTAVDKPDDMGRDGKLRRSSDIALVHVRHDISVNSNSSGPEAATAPRFHPPSSWSVDAYPDSEITHVGSRIYSGA